MWTEKHRPRELSEIRGQDQAISNIRSWARSWEGDKPSSKAVLLYGPAGTGKTSAALALSQEMEWDVVEVNASDKRSKSSLEELAKSCRTRYSILTGRGIKLVVLDEIDGLSGTQDRGGVKTISKMIRETVNPIIMTCNDYYSSKLRYLRRKVKGIEFKKPSTRDVQNVLREICRDEGIPVDNLALRTLAERCQGDLRSAINDLQALTVDGELSREDLRTPSTRNQETDIFRVLDLIFEGDPDAISKARDLNMRPSQLLNWIAENVHKRFRDPGTRADAYEVLSTADIYLSWVYRRMHWGFWGYATEIMTRGLGALTGRRYSSFRRRYRYSYPSSYLRYRVLMKNLRRAGDKDSSGRGDLGDELDVARMIGKRCHMSARAVHRDFLPYLRVIQENDPQMAGGILRSVGISEEEMCDLPYG